MRSLSRPQLSIETPQILKAIKNTSNGKMMLNSLCGASSTQRFESIGM
jgi:hypothetical protein